MTYRVADALTDTLLHHGVDRVFSVPGESFLPVLDALLDRPQIDLVTCRHEGSAALAAVADARLTGRPGVLFVSRGPGMSNASIGVHVAQQDALPLVVFVGQVDRPNLGRGAFQEVDYARMFGGVAKWVGSLAHADHAGEVVARALALAQAGTPGPVLVVLPEDVLAEPCATPARKLGAPAHAAPVAKELSEVAAFIAASQRPVTVVGGECRNTGFRDALLTFSEAWQMPVAVTNKNQDLFANDHPHWLGHLGFFVSPSVAALLQHADLVLAVGTRLGDVTSQGYTFPAQQPTPQALIHVYPDANAIGRHFLTLQAVVSTGHAFLRAMNALPRPPLPARSDWLAEVAQAREGAHGWDAARTPEADVFGHVVQALSQHLAHDAIVALDAGNFSTWVHRVLRFRRTQRLLSAACGAMGMGVPAALAASLRYPHRQVLAFCGDGGFLMTGNELATAVGRQLPLKIVVANNGAYGTIRSYQERQFPHRVSGTALHNPDFAVLARAYGAGGFRIGSSSEACEEVARFLAHPGPAVLDVACDIEQIMAATTLSALRPRTAAVHVEMEPASA
ncbi:thiamine pyrophosphate-dependent enzyme [Hydrogenophaga sp. BPS33]|uniref:thiamine pyrophosphate-dependent enzyme n=1 Tax=Hydrogenophaga sp. BPS33 TaxID=2651974 RepID=UPI00131F8C59|nr:thiamine pyrophosphate-dependent enzyme [Hydrogenophaga sp. BPS33]QHE84537.1 decarboxylase [Hydrogenophaga sp. BPS33]